jgi:hypothetical protein
MTAESAAISGVMIHNATIRLGAVLDDNGRQAHDAADSVVSEQTTPSHRSSAEVNHRPTSKYYDLS